jgi:hypothetical protein
MVFVQRFPLKSPLTCQLIGFRVEYRISLDMGKISYFYIPPYFRQKQVAEVFFRQIPATKGVTGKNLINPLVLLDFQFDPNCTDKLLRC